MKFYKVHAAKFKTSRVIFIPEQFDEIGPDAFHQTNFEAIILSRKVKIIRNHAFSNLKNCRVYIPETVLEIEPLAFEDIEEGNVFYCVNHSPAYKTCLENGLKINEEIESCIEYAEALKKEEIEEKAADIKQQAEDRAAATKQEVQVDRNQSSKEEPELKKEDVQEQPPQKNANPEYRTGTEEKQSRIESDESSFIEKFGLSPSVEIFTNMGLKWEQQISQLPTEDIIKNYESSEYCEEYKYFCYMELKRRFQANNLNLYENNRDLEAKEEEPIENNVEDEYSETDELINLLGIPPKCSYISGYHTEWSQQIKQLSTSEVLKRYNSEEWCEEYRFLCYQELKSRSDLAKVVSEMQRGVG